MGIRSLNRLRKLRDILTGTRRRWLAARHGIRLDPSVSVSLSARMVSGAPGSIEVGAESLIAFKTLLLTVEAASGDVRPIRIGRRCFIGGGSLVLPGVTIGDESIVGAGSVVTHDVPPRTIVGGVPARVLRQDIVVGPFGRLAGADENSRRLWR